MGSVPSRALWLEISTEDELETFGGSNDGDADDVGELACICGHAVKFDIIVAGVVVKHHQRLCTALARDLDGVRRSAMAPVGFVGKLVGTELSIVDEHVDSVA